MQVFLHRARLCKSYGILEQDRAMWRQLCAATCQTNPQRMVVDTCFFIVALLSAR